MTNTASDKSVNTDYLRAQQVASILHTHHAKMHGLLKKYQPIMPQGAIISKKHNTTDSFLLHKDFIDMFCTVANIKKYNIKTPEWLNSREIAQRLHIKHNNIYTLLRNIHDNDMLPKSVLNERLSGKTTTVCLHQDSLQDFINIAGITVIPQKDEQWLSPDDIRKKFSKKLINMPKMLQQLRNQMPSGAIEFRKRGPKIHLCLNQAYISEFCEITGLRIYEVKDDEKWIGARELENLFHIDVPQMPILFEQMQSKLPAGAIEYKKRGPKITLYLRRDYIHDFLNLSGLRQIKPSLQTMVSQHTK